jgi:hypothetical protein
MKRIELRLVALFALIALTSGCGGTGLDTAAVNGTVKVAGTPMAGVQVTFTPANGRPASGVTDASGNYSLSTLAANDGAVPGKHKVKFAYSDPAAATPDSSNPTPSAEVPSPFNTKYMSDQTSGHEVEVVAGKTNKFDFDLEK